MKKTQLKKVLKPIIKECIHEILLREGLLADVITEVSKGFGVRPINDPAPMQPINNQKKNTINSQKKSRVEEQKTNNNLKQLRAKMLKAVNKDAYGGVDVFEGVAPMHEQVAQSATALEGVSPDDPGVDINGIMSIAGKRWSKLI